MAVGSIELVVEKEKLRARLESVFPLVKFNKEMQSFAYWCFWVNFCGWCHWIFTPFVHSWRVEFLYLFFMLSVSVFAQLFFEKLFDSKCFEFWKKPDFDIRDYVSLKAMEVK